MLYEAVLASKTCNAASLLLVHFYDETERTDKALMEATLQLAFDAARDYDLKRCMPVVEAKKTAYDRRNVNQPWYSRFQKKRSRR